MPSLMVEKKNGQQEPFDRNKIINGLLKSGAAQPEAENIVSQVEAWAQTAAVNGVIRSFAIRAKVLEFLHNINPTAAQAFESYQKPVQSQ